MPAAQMAFDFAQRRTVPNVPVPAPAPVAKQVPRSPAQPDGAVLRLQKEREIEQRLSRLMSGEVAVHLTDNGRTMLSARDRGGVSHVRLHHMFMQADDSVLRALASFLRSGSAAASAQLQRFIRDHGKAIRRRARVVKLRAHGHHHDLRAILAEVCAHYFEGVASVRIGWARMARAQRRSRKRRSIKLGSYRSRDTLVRVHPVLDAAWVPRFFVEYIVYHELLHHVLGMPMRNGRRDLHGPEFRAREQRFERYAEALAWERQHLDRLLSG